MFECRCLDPVACWKLQVHRLTIRVDEADLAIRDRVGNGSRVSVHGRYRIGRSETFKHPYSIVLCDGLVEVTGDRNCTAGIIAS
jgi:hypothetical protein